MMLLNRSLLLVLMVATLSGCGVFNTFGTANTPEPAALPVVNSTLSFDKLWQKNVGDGSDDAFLRLNPVYAHGVIYSVDIDAKVVATDANGKNLFTQKLKTSGHSGIGSNDTRITLVDGRAQLFMLDGLTGKIVWQVPVHNQVLAAPTMSADTTYIKTIDGVIAAYQNSTGALLWTYNHGGPPLMLRMSSAVVLNGTTLYAAFNDGQVVALDARTGNVLWEQIVATANGFAEIERMIDIDAKLVINNGTLYSASYQGSLSALNLQSGKVLWQQPISAYADLAVVDNLVIVPEANGTMKAFNGATGQLAWSQNNLAWRFLTGAVAFNHAIVLSDVQGYVHVVDAKSGQYLGRTQPTKKPIYSLPLVANDHVYSLDSTGKLTGLLIK